MLQKALKEGFTPPLSLAWGFIAIGIIVAIIMPVSGAYLLIIQGVILLIGIIKLTPQTIVYSESTRT